MSSVGGVPLEWPIGALALDPLTPGSTGAWPFDHCEELEVL